MGCGLGYVAYMLSLKDDVNKVTIVELDKDVKTMFETYLKPQMNSKINIVEGDALEYLEVADISNYDYCSVDIWHGGMEMYPIYVKCLLLEQKHKNTKFHYWLEEDLHLILETVWLIAYKKLINNEPINGDVQQFIDIFNSQNIKTVEDVKAFLMAPKREIITSWALKNPTVAKDQDNLSIVIAKMLQRKRI